MPQTLKTTQIFENFSESGNTVNKTISRPEMFQRRRAQLLDVKPPASVHLEPNPGPRERDLRRVVLVLLQGRRAHPLRVHL